MRTARIVYQNELIQSGVVITASSADFGYPVTNLADPARWKTWRSTSSTGDQWVKFDLGAAKTLKVLQIADFVAHTGGVIRAQANATDVWTAPTLDTALTLPNPNYTRTAGIWITTQTLRWVRFLFQNSGAVNMKVSLGVAAAGDYIEPAVSLAPGYTIGRTLGSEVHRVPGGQRSAERKTDYFTLKAGFMKEAEADRQNLMKASYSLGNHTPHFFAINPDDPAYMVFYGRFDSGFDYEHIVLGRWNMPFSWSEDV